MAFSLEYKKQEYAAGFLFCGMGGGAAGFQEAESHFKGMVGTFRTVVGIDGDPEVCRAFEMITGSRAVCRDLFSREQYEAFHGKKPPKGWREATPEDIRKDCGGVAPDVWFTSAPCKGFSGLLPSKSALSGKYQALNRLTVRGLKLILEAFPKDPPAAILFENVPRITTRGEDLLREIKALLSSYGYLFHEGFHDCGEIGGLGQRRKRYLLIARNPQKLASFIYQPPKLRVKSIGEIIGPLPMPDDPSCGPMHRMPRLQWKTWVRLALIPAGGDWRDLEKIAQEKYRLEYVPQSGGAYGVQNWEKPGSTVTGTAHVSGTNAVSVADVRLPEKSDKHPNCYRVVKFDEPGPCVVGSRFGSGAPAVADPRLESENPKFNHAYKVTPFDEPSGAVAGGTGPSSGATCVADKRGRHHSHFRVTAFDETAGTVTGADHVANGAPNVADPRVSKKIDHSFDNAFKVTPWDKSAGTVTGGDGPSNGAISVQDRRINSDFVRRSKKLGPLCVGKWEEPISTITSGNHVTGMQGVSAIADPRVKKEYEHNSKKNGPLAIGKWEEPINTIAGSCGVNEKSGIGAVADPRYFDNAYGVQKFDEPSGAVTGGKSPSCGDKCVADPRMRCKPRAGTMEVQEWDKPSDAVVGTANVHAGGASAVADPRIPADNERPDPVPVIISLDNTWHRPLTTLELLVLQSFEPFLPDGRPVVLPGNSDGKWREWIGNSVPPKTAREIAKQILTALLMNGKQDFMLHSEPVWVRQPEQESTDYSDDPETIISLDVVEACYDGVKEVRA